MMPARKAKRSRRTAQSAWLLPANLGVGLSVASLCLALLGYGYALAVETLFGVPESMFADGTLDYVRLSTHVIAYTVTGASEHLRSADSYVRLCAALWPYLSAVTLLWAAGWLVVRWVRLRSCLLAGAKVAVRALRTNRVWHTAGRWFKAAAWPLVSLAGIWAAAPALLCLLMLAVGMLAAMVAVVPLVGYTVGMHSLQTWVVEPSACLAPRNRERRLELPEEKANEQSAKTKGVTCVSMVGEGGSVEMQGRLVVATAKWALLFDPATGLVRRVSVQNATVTPVASLSASGVALGAAGKAVTAGSAATP